MLDERAERIHQSPDLADLARRATLRTLDLWARQRRDDEFLRTRLGIGTVASQVSVEPESAGEEYLRDATAATITGYDRLPACPICVNVAELGVFGLHGALDRRAGDVLVDHPPGGHAAQSRGPRARRRRGRAAGPRCVGEVAAAHPLGDVADLGRPRRRGRGRRRRDDPRARGGRPAAHEHRRPRRPPLAVDPRDPRRERQRRRRPRVAATRPLPPRRHLGGRVRRLRCPRAAPGQGDDRLRAAARRHAGAVDGVVHRPGDPARTPRAGTGQRPTDRSGGDVAGAASRRDGGERDHRDPTRRAAAVAVRTGAADAAVDRRAVGRAQAVRVARPDRHRPCRPARARPRRARSARVDRRHVGRRQERAAAVDRGRADPRVSADPSDVPVRRLQGRGGERGVQRRPAHRRLRHQPRSEPLAAGVDVVARRAQPPHAAARGQGQGPRRRCSSATPRRRRRPS